MNLKLYTIVSTTKLILWFFIIFFTYTSINIYEDPVVAISLWFIWTFISIWWFSFFLFLWWQKIFRKKSIERITKDSYKLSLLFGIYCIINALLLILWWRNKILWIMLLWLFIVIHILLLENKNETTEN